MAVIAGTSVAATSVRKPTTVDTVRIGGSSACTGISIPTTEFIILDSGVDVSATGSVSAFPYPGADHHHIIYLKSVGTSCTVEASADNSSYITIATVVAADGATIVRTGNVTELPFRYIKVAATGTVTLDVQTFPALVR